jgi:hypothetical protein
VARRLRAGVPLAAGDRDHGYDLLSRRWGSRARATAAFVALAAVGSAAAVALVATTT